MTCGRQLTDEIRTLAGQTASAANRVAVAGPDGIELAIDVTAADTMSCSCSEIRLRVPALAGAGSDVLAKWAQDLCAKVTYLMEPLGPLEIDADGKQVLIRSKSPDKRENATTFYEILLQSQGAGLFTLRRYRREDNHAPREHVDLHITLEVLEKLADDLIATIPSPTP